MKKIFTLTYFFTVIFTQQIATPGIKVWGTDWITSPDKAFEIAMVENKLILMYCREPMDQNCAFVEERIFADSQIETHLDRMIQLRLDVGRYKGILSKYGISERKNLGYPYSPELWILDAFGDVIYSNVWDNFLRDSEYKAMDAQAMKTKTQKLLQALPSNVSDYYFAKIQLMLEPKNLEFLVQTAEALFHVNLLFMSNKYYTKALKRLPWALWVSEEIKIHIQAGMAINHIGLRNYMAAIKLFKRVLKKTQVGDLRREIWHAGLAKSYKKSNRPFKYQEALKELIVEFPNTELVD